MLDSRLLLFSLGDGGDERDRLTGAIEVAATFGAHLRVMHSTLDPQALLPKDIAVPRSVLAELDQAMVQHATQDTARLRSTFAELCKSRGITLTDGVADAAPNTASWFEVRGVRSALVARHGKLADWVVVSQPPDGRATASLQAAVMETGRPVMMLPRRLSSLSVETVMVAWNGSPQAARALAAALGLLRRADRVLVVTTPDVEARGPAVAEVADHLAVHEIQADGQVVESAAAHEGPALLDTAARETASMLVMGAYSAHKVRDLLLGSVTGHVVAHCPVPVLMSE